MRVLAAILLAAWCLTYGAPASAQSLDPKEEAGAWIGVTLGNLVFVPLKAVTVASGAAMGALSFVLTGGDTEVAQQMWQDTLSAPYVITPELARAGVGSRPELEAK